MDAPDRALIANSRLCRHGWHICDTDRETAMSFVALESLNKQFGNFTAVRDRSLSIGKGEFILSLGPSGRGKTTTLQMIAGLLEPTSGCIMPDGKDVSRAPPTGAAWASLSKATRFSRI